MKVRGTPYDFPITGEFDPAITALVVVDMQRDFCDPQGYMAARGGDVSAAKAIVPRIQQVRVRAAAAGLRIIHTREGHRADLSDLPESKRLKTARAGAEIGSRGPLGRLLVRGEAGWQFIAELAPLPGEIVIDKPGTGAFHGTDLYHVLITSGISNLVLVGVTTGVCITSTAREASDRGFNVLVLGDCCAEPDPKDHDMAMHLLQIEGGYLATTATSADFIAQLAGGVS
ncbi:cysteine hydrolase [Burkholderia sp. WAC0059]|uniref:cysteine hydrolase family protein n=1 Tax=Burkholderia sp. WAC0059 TaxID=2066022 RepID=UPI000C7F1F8F|nr:isochorismatase family cysteine hydrolase [Burkholderia sp. WAC0059]PLZ00630.1 cysteine hydrolase [Burkholderia sp. WAC0059]